MQEVISLFRNPFGVGTSLEETRHGLSSTAVNGKLQRRKIVKVDDIGVCFFTKEGNQNIQMSTSYSFVKSGLTLVVDGIDVGSIGWTEAKLIVRTEEREIME